MIRVTYEYLKPVNCVEIDSDFLKLLLIKYTSTNHLTVCKQINNVKLLLLHCNIWDKLTGYK